MTFIYYSPLNKLRGKNLQRGTMPATPHPDKRHYARMPPHQRKCISKTDHPLTPQVTKMSQKQHLVAIRNQILLSKLTIM